MAAAIIIVEAEGQFFAPQFPSLRDKLFTYTLAEKVATAQRLASQGSVGDLLAGMGVAPEETKLFSPRLSSLVLQEPEAVELAMFAPSKAIYLRELW